MSNKKEEYVLKVSFDPKLKQYKNHLWKQATALNIPGFFTHDLKISQDIHKEFEKHFSKQHYGEDSAGTFEAWPVMTLLKQSMEIGYRLGQNKQKIYKMQKQSHELLKKLDKFDFILKKGKERQHINWNRVVKVVVENSGTKNEKVILHQTSVVDTSKIETKELKPVFKVADLTKAIIKYHESIYQLIREDRWKP